MPCYQNACYQDVLLPKRPVTEMSSYRNVQLPKCPKCLDTVKCVHSSSLSGSLQRRGAGGLREARAGAARTAQCSSRLVRGAAHQQDEGRPRGPAPPPDGSGAAHLPADDDTPPGRRHLQRHSVAGDRRRRRVGAQRRRRQ